MSRKLTFVILSILGLIATLSMVRAGHATLLVTGGATDFHSYWYSGHFFRISLDPWNAYIDGIIPTGHFNYLGVRESFSTVPRDELLGHVPANTAPIVLFISLFSWLSWSTARFVWSLLLLCLACLIPFLTFRLIPYRIPRQMKWILVLVFLSLKSTRAAISTGQTTLLVFTLMLSVVLLWRKERWLLSGVCLGVALSKYSLALPVFLYALYKRRWRVALISFVVQFSGLLIVWGITGSDPMTIIKAYYAIAMEHAIMPGLHLQGVLKPETWLHQWSPLLISLIVFPLIWLGWKRQRSKSILHDTVVLVTLLIWGLLSTYHRIYDAVLIFPFITLMVVWWQNPTIWTVPQPLRFTIIGATIFGLILPILPSWQIRNAISWSFVSQLLTLIEQSVTILLLYMLCVLLLLCFIQTEQSE